MIRDSFPGINSPGQAPVEHAPGHALGFSGASVKHAPGFSGGVGLWAGVVRSSPGRRLTFSGNPGEFSSPSQNPGGISGNLHHQTASFAGAPITPRERCHVTQPRAGINVSCSRAGQKGAKGGGDHETATREEGQQRTAKDGCQIGNPQFENSCRVYLPASWEIDTQRVESPKSSGSGNEHALASTDRK